MLSRPKRGEHCDRHPRFFAGLRLDCGNDHQLCVGCIRRWLDEGGDGKLCPMCRQQIANGGCDIGELKELIKKLQADQSMTKMDPAMPLASELTTEIFRFMDSLKMPLKLLTSRIVYSLAIARKNAWNTDSELFGHYWSGGRDVAINVEEKAVYAMALRPFECTQNCKQHVDYFEVKMDRFVQDSWVFVGLTCFQKNYYIFYEQPPDSYGITCDGFYLVNRKSIENFIDGFRPGDVVGCGLVTKSHWKTKRQLFFTKNGQIIGKPFWIVPEHNKLYPVVSLRGLGTQVTANFGGNPARPFLYDVNKSSDHLQAPEMNKGKKHKADEIQQSGTRKSSRKRKADDTAL